MSRRKEERTGVVFSVSVLRDRRTREVGETALPRSPVSRILNKSRRCDFRPLTFKDDIVTRACAPARTFYKFSPACAASFVTWRRAAEDIDHIVSATSTQLFSRGLGDAFRRGMRGTTASSLECARGKQMKRGREREKSGKAGGHFPGNPIELKKWNQRNGERSTMRSYSQVAILRLAKSSSGMDLLLNPTL